VAEERSLVKNAADETQVKDAANKEKRGRERDLEDLAFLLSDKRGRRAMWRILSYCGTFKSIWEPSAKIHYNAGQQDVGHYMLNDLMDASEENYILMAKEAKKEKLNV
jgi:hypothetical protein